eukprot:30804-Pelagococcus_subviridis.AAC.4
MPRPTTHLLRAYCDSLVISKKHPLSPRSFSTRFMGLILIHHEGCTQSAQVTDCRRSNQPSEGALCAVTFTVWLPGHPLLFSGSESSHLR